MQTNSIRTPVGEGSVGTAREALSLGPEYDGLFCIGWEHTGDGSIRITLKNFHQTCGVDWTGTARVRSDGVDLDLVNSGCRVAHCGWCIYDATFEVRGVASDSDTNVEISVVDDSGAACQNGVDGTGTPRYSATLPTKQEADGVICRPALQFAVFEQAMTLGTCGAHLTPCGPSQCTACNDGLTCAPITTSDDQRCLHSCAADTDCPLPGVLSCQSGFCRLARTW
jgi:hypothetical protein